MAIRRKKRRREVEPPTEERLALYEATQVPTGAGRTGLPPARNRRPLPGSSTTDRRSVRHAVPEPIIDLRQPATSGKHALDRRLEPRFPLTLPAAASREGGEGSVVGTTVDVSIHGMQLRMPDPPPDTHLDFVVGDDDGCSVIWAKVVANRVLPYGEFHWHALIVSSDDAWFPIVERA